MNHAFVDIEALRLKQPWLAPLMQVSLVIFTEEALVIPNAGVDCYVTPTSLPGWAVPEASTLEWWKQQEGWGKMEAKRWREGEEVKQVLLQLVEEYKKNECVALWASGPQYDLAALDSYFDYYEIEKPWKHNDVRDFRTIRKQHQDITYVYPEGGNLHNAWQDCLFSIAHLRKITVQKGINWY